jgi:glycosyltransferase involved in cell wall biosynthesis
VQIDVSLVLNLHKEGKYVLRTLLSLKDAAIFARVSGISVELIVVLDRPDTVTLGVVRAFDFSGFAQYQVIEVTHGSLGPARNDGIRRAGGKYVRVCDGDDLVSYNLVLAMYLFAEHLGPNAILHPEWLLSFGNHYYRGHHRDLDVVTPLSLIDSHPFGSEIFFHRSLFNQLQYADVRLTSGYAFEDWHLVTEAVASGFNLYVVPDTIIFYRQRRDSLLKQANSLSVQQIPPSRFFTPETYCVICAASYSQYLGGHMKREFEGDAKFIESNVCFDLIQAASTIEPAIDLHFIKQGSSYQTTTQSNIEIGRRYFEICALLEKKRGFSEIFFVSHFRSRMDERYFTDLINELSVYDDAVVLIIIGDELPNDRWQPRFSTSVTIVNLAQWLSEIGPQGVDLISLKLVQSLGESARLHACPGASGERFFAAYGRALDGHKRIFYRSNSSASSDDGSSSRLPAFEFLSDSIESIDVVVCDNNTIAEFDRRRIGVFPDKWKILPARHMPAMNKRAAVERSSRGVRRFLYSSSSSDHGGRLLPSLTNLLIKEWSDTNVDIYSHRSPARGTLSTTTRASVDYKRGVIKFSDIALCEYFCLILTGVFEDVTRLLLEAAGAGIPIVGPDIAVIAEFVENGLTGMLIPNLAAVDRMAEAYFGAIVRLERDRGLRTRIVEGAYDRAVNDYGPQSFREKLLQVLT